MKTSEEVIGQANKLLAEIEEVMSNPEATGEDRTEAHAKLVDVKALKAQAQQMRDIQSAAAELQEIVQDAPLADGPESPPKFKSIGEFYGAVHSTLFQGAYDPRLSMHTDKEPKTGRATKSGWAESGAESKQMVENVGAAGGFLVPVEQITELYQFPAPEIVVRPRCTVIPMRRRQLQIPVLDQSGTAAGQPHWFGGALAYWTEEAQLKDETRPVFKQDEWVAHKLALYTEASDELLDDSAVPLEGLLNNIFRAAIAWYEEDAFIVGTGAGQPLGIAHVNCGATIAVPRAVAGAIGLADLINMLEAYGGGNAGVWLCNRAGLSNLMQIAGPAGNPSYVFMPNAREGMPATLFGYPLIFSEHCPALGVRGDIILADWRYYVIGDRQATTVMASKHYKFRYDITSWVAVHRVDGQPWLNDPLTLKDGTTQISPFVVLDSAVTS